MKTIIGITSLALAFCMSASGQDVPCLSQRLTRSFLYNPALAGDAFGSVTYSFRKNYSGVQDGPTNNFLSAHAPLHNYRIGVGLSLMEERVNVLQNYYAAAAFAYHLYFNEFTSLSFGLAAEINSSKISRELNFVPQGADPVIERLQGGSQNHPDFSAGVHFQSGLFRAGASVNRLSRWWNGKQHLLFERFFSIYSSAEIPVRNGNDIIEPYVAVRSLNLVNRIIDASVFYTIEDKLLGGLGYRSGNVFNLTVGYYIRPNWLIGVSREMYLNNDVTHLGSSNEIVLRYNFLPKSNRSVEAIRRYSIPIKYVRAKGPDKFHRINDRYMRRASRYLKFQKSGDLRGLKKGRTRRR